MPAFSPPPSFGSHLCFVVPDEEAAALSPLTFALTKCVENRPERERGGGTMKSGSEAAAEEATLQFRKHN